MAEQPFLSKRQRGIVNTYYANADAGLSQRLSELVSDLYMALGDETKAGKLWKTAGDLLGKSSADPGKVRKVVETRDLEALARMAPTLKAAEKPQPPK